MIFNKIGFDYSSAWQCAPNRHFGTVKWLLMFQSCGFRSLGDQLWQFCLFTLPFKWKWASTLQRIVFAVRNCCNIVSQNFLRIRLKRLHNLNFKGVKFKVLFQYFVTIVFGSPWAAALLRTDCRGLSRKLFATNSMLSSVLDVRLGPSGLFSAELVVLNFRNQNRIKSSPGPSRNHWMLYRKLNLRRATAQESFALNYASIANARCSPVHCDRTRTPATPFNGSKTVRNLNPNSATGQPV